MYGKYMTFPAAPVWAPATVDTARELHLLYPVPREADVPAESVWRTLIDLTAGACDPQRRERLPEYLGFLTSFIAPGTPPWKGPECGGGDVLTSVWREYREVAALIHAIEAIDEGLDSYPMATWWRGDAVMYAANLLLGEERFAATMGWITHESDRVQYVREMMAYGVGLLIPAGIGGRCACNACEVCLRTRIAETNERAGKVLAEWDAVYAAHHELPSSMHPTVIPAMISEAYERVVLP